MTAINHALTQMNGPHHMMDGWGMGPGMLFMVLFLILILILLATLIWFLLRKGRESTPDGHSESALEILQKRYARGEINDEEFQRMKEYINS